jgi:hypothetical protein
MIPDTTSKRPIERPWRWLMAPALAAAYPVLFLYAEFARETNELDALICLIVVVAAAIGATLLLRIASAGPPRASLAVVVFVVWSFAFSSYMRMGRYLLEIRRLSPWNDFVLYLLWMLLLFLTLFFVLRLGLRARRLERVYQFVLLACIGSIGFAAVRGVREYLLLNHEPSVEAPIWARDSEAVPEARSPEPLAEPRDVYYILLDRYGSEESLRRFFKFDNSEFGNELEMRGFVVNRKAITSYPMTSTSMASTLNMRYLNPKVADASDYFETVEANEVAKLFMQAGYKYFFFGNQYEGLRKSSIANWNMKISVMPSEFADSLVAMTPFRPLIGRQYKYRFTSRKFAAVAELAKDPAATFAYAHFLVPHPPYAFARDGSQQTEVNRATRPEKELYIDQLVATNRLVLQTIDEIQSASAKPPIIILHADEGPYLMAGDESLSPKEKMAKRLGILNAILIPDDAIRQRLPKPLMPVNTFRFLFKEYFGAPIEMLPNRSFFWEKPEPNGTAEAGSRIIEVTKDVLPK